MKAIECAVLDDERLAAEAYTLLERLATGQLPDADLARLHAISTYLDQRNVPYEGRW